ncbi:methyltransferase [Clostridia bacterium]|nr:methyltransferase [Clostridia bacterium]
MLEIIMLSLAGIKPNPNNAKEHPPEQIEQIVRSIDAFGMNDPIAVDENNVIIEGHGRLLALQKMNAENAPCIRLSHLSEEQKRAYILAHNKLTLNTGFDIDVLKGEFDFLNSAEFDVTLSGFTQDELDAMFKTEADVVEDDFDLTKALEEAAFVQRGDIWTVGRHRVMCGDATDAGDVARLMDARKANLVLTDPPYGVKFQSSSGLSIKNDALKPDEFYAFLLASFKNMADHLEPGGSAYVFHADTEGLNFRKSFVDAGFHLSGVCIWAKDSFVLGRSPYQWQHEPILYGWISNGKHSWYAGRSEKTIWNFNKPKRNEDHPTSKPIDLLAYPIQNSSQANGIVLDTFGGSGSTLLACEQTDRICCMMELDEKYTSVILRRFVAFAGNSDNVYVERDGKQIPYADLVKDVVRREAGR